ncbi:MAG: VIT1/CCC1 transporter family protein [Microthrixaceae bacterium]
MPTRHGHGHDPQRHGGSPRHREVHRAGRSGWLRAAVLGANDGILSTGALLLGVASADASRSVVLTAGVAGLVAGAASMAIGEYVSVSSQRDAERADRAVEARELARDPVGEHAELTGIYVGRGLTRELASEVATQLMRDDALGAHLRDEHGQHESNRARPFQAAWSSFVSFAVGAALPLLVAAVAGFGMRVPAIAVATLVGLLGLGALAAGLAGAPVARGAVRVGIGGVIALALTFLVGQLLGSTVD